MKMVAARQNDGRIDESGTFVRNNQVRFEMDFKA